MIIKQAKLILFKMLPSQAIFSLTAQVNNQNFPYNFLIHNIAHLLTKPHLKEQSSNSHLIFSLTC